MSDKTGFINEKTDFIDEIYVPRVRGIIKKRRGVLRELGHTEVVREICPTPITDFIDEVYIPRKKDTSEKLNN
jgi:hypothetical protein